MTILDDTTTNVTGRRQLHTRYGHEGAAKIDVPAILAKAKSLPKRAHFQLDYEPPPALDIAVEITRKIKAARPDLRVSWYGATDLDLTAAAYAAEALAALEHPASERTDRQHWVIGQLNADHGLLQLAQSRRANDRCRDLFNLCDEICVAYYPTPGDNAESIARNTAAMIDEGHRLARGKPVLLLLRATLVNESTREVREWDRDELAAAKTVIHAGNVMVALWDDAAKAKQVFAVMEGLR